MMEDMIRKAALLAPVLSLSLSGWLEAKAPQQPVAVTTTQSADYSTGTTIRIGGTAGELNIEAWDQPRVEATLTTTEYANANKRDATKKKLEQIGLGVEKKGNEIGVELKTPSRHFWAKLLRGKTNATVVCRVMVPRDAKLVVRHQNGSVLVYGAAGDIDASAQFGDIVLQMADPGQYAIDAKVRMGGVYTDYTGQYKGRLRVGDSFVSEGTTGAHKLTLRVGIGGIDIVKMGPVSTTAY